VDYTSLALSHWLCSSVWGKARLSVFTTPALRCCYPFAASPQDGYARDCQCQLCKYTQLLFQVAPVAWFIPPMQHVSRSEILDTYKHAEFSINLLAFNYKIGFFNILSITCLIISLYNRNNAFSSSELWLERNRCLHWCKSTVLPAKSYMAVAEPTVSKRLSSCASAQLPFSAITGVVVEILPSPDTLLYPWHCFFLLIQAMIMAWQQEINCRTECASTHQETQAVTSWVTTESNAYTDDEHWTRTAGKTTMPCVCLWWVWSLTPLCTPDAVSHTLLARIPTVSPAVNDLISSRAFPAQQCILRYPRLFRFAFNCELTTGCLLHRCCERIHQPVFIPNFVCILLFE